jgi:hypothetical protein
MKNAILIALLISTITVQAQDVTPAALEAIPEAVATPLAVEASPSPEEQPALEEAPVTASSFAVKKNDSELRNWIFAATAIVTVTAGLLLTSCYPGSKAPPLVPAK